MEYIRIVKKIRKTSNYNIYKGRHILSNRVVILKETNHNVSNEGIPGSAIR